MSRTFIEKEIARRHRNSILLAWALTGGVALLYGLGLLVPR